VYEHGDEFVNAVKKFFSGFINKTPTQNVDKEKLKNAEKKSILRRIKNWIKNPKPKYDLKKPKPKN
jgi:hypothetical protein